MAGTAGYQPGGPEYVTDWRVVYASLGVVSLMILGGLTWTLFAPASAVPIANAVADTPAVFVAAAEPADQTDVVDIVLPWAPLPQEPLRPDSTRSLPPSKPDATAKPEPVTATPVALHESVNERLAIARLKEPTRPGALFAELERAITLDFNPIKAPSPHDVGARRVVPRQPVAGHSGEETGLNQEEQFAEFANQSDLAGLPILGEDDCHKSPKEVTELGRLSRQVSVVSRSRGGPRTRSISHSQELSVDEKICDLIEGLYPDSTSVAPLVQMLQVRGVRVRAKLVYALSGIDGPAASQALADRAMFDLSPEIRALAIEHLKRRDGREYRWRLLSGFRYPWPPVASHAADAVVALRDSAALPILQELLDEPDPRQPFVADDGTWKKSELVRVNHLRNCLLCHPRSFARNDKVRAAVPTPGRPLPRAYYESLRGDAVRADVTYLTQDFSVIQPVTDHSPWPNMQRFDFLVRTRPLTEEETQRQSNSTSDANVPSSYPQRESVLVAIKGLNELGT